MIDNRGFHVDAETIFNPSMIKSITRKERNEESKRLESIEAVKKPEYMKWLTDFVKYYRYVSDSPSFPPPYNTKKDSENIKRLGYFYMYVDDFASKNYYPSSDSYNIKYEDRIYEIKIFMGQGGMCFVRENNEAEDFILYDDLVNDKELDRKTKISSELNKYKEYLLDLLKEDVPEYALQETFNDTVKEFEKIKIKK